MELKKFNDLGIKLEEGILVTKYLVNIHLADYENAKKVKKTFEAHKYNIDVVPGIFLKEFTMNEKEITELEKALVEVDELGLKDIFNANLRVDSFRSVVERVKFCIANNLPYLNSDNTFIDALRDKEAFAKYSSEIPLNLVATVKEVDEGVEEAKTKSSEEVIAEAKMDLEDKQVYNVIIERLNYLLLKNPTDELLANVVKNTTNKVVESLMRKEYKFLDLNDIVKNVMFDGIDITPVENVRIEELIDEAFPERQEKEMGRLA